MGRHHGGYVGARMMQDQPESITALAFEIVADPETRKTRLIDFGHDPIVAQTRRTASEHGMVWPFTLRITAMRGHLLRIARGTTTVGHVASCSIQVLTEPSNLGPRRVSVRMMATSDRTGAPAANSIA